MTPHIFVAAEYEKAFEAVYEGDKVGNRQQVAAFAAPGSAEASEMDVQRLRDMASEAPTIRLVNQIITGAVELRASDIHIEPNVDAVLVRYRIDGRFARRRRWRPACARRSPRASRSWPSSISPSAALPQDGRIKIAIRGVDIDFRVSTIPDGVRRERGHAHSRPHPGRARLRASLALTRRILPRSGHLLDAAERDHPGDRPDRQRQDDDALYRAQGAQQPGHERSSPSRIRSNTSSTGINQVQVQPAIGLDFPHALRSILRQDPDIIMIGEIRDLETARIAIQASLTGHLVLSTLHTNSAAATITRLIDMGVENYLLASTVNGHRGAAAGAKAVPPLLPRA